jgi:hypothetical protein
VIIESRKGTGGAASTAVRSMIGQCERSADDLSRAVERRRQGLDQAVKRLLEQARTTADLVKEPEDPDD